MADEEAVGDASLRGLFPASAPQAEFAVSLVAHKEADQVLPPAPAATPAEEPLIRRELPPEGPYGFSNGGYDACGPGGNCGDCDHGHRAPGPRRPPGPDMCWICDQYEPEWYISGMGGFAQPRNQEIPFAGLAVAMHPDGGGQGGAAVGWATGPTWLGRRRVEVEVVGRHSDLESVTINNLHAPTIGDVTVASGMVNVLWDFKSKDRDWYPYIGGGLGVARMSIEATQFPLGPDELSENAFAWQAIGGVSWRLRSYLELFAEARYFSTGDFNYDAVNATTFVAPGGATLAPGSRTLSTEYSAFNTMIGLRFILGKRRCDPRDGAWDGRPAVGGGGWHFTPNP